MKSEWHESAETMHALPLAFARKILRQNLGGLRIRLGFGRDTRRTESNQAFAGYGTRHGLRQDKFWTPHRPALDFD